MTDQGEVSKPPLFDSVVVALIYQSFPLWTRQGELIPLTPDPAKSLGPSCAESCTVISCGFSMMFLHRHRLSTPFRAT